MVSVINRKITIYFPKSLFNSLGRRFHNGFFIAHRLTSQIVGLRRLDSLRLVFSDLAITKLYYAVCHILNGIVVGNHDDGISVLLVDLLDQTQNFLRCVVIQCTCRLVAKKDVRIFYNSTTNGSSLLLSTGELVGKLMSVLIKSQCVKQLVNI